MGNEDKLQIQIVSYVQYQYPDAIFTHCPNGGKRNVIEATKLKRMGVSAGVPDLLFFQPIGIYTGLAIELKFGINKPTDNQKRWINNLIACGWLVEVCYDFETAIAVIDKYFNQKIK